MLVFGVKLNRLTLGENMEEKIIYYGTLLELYGELLTDKQYSAIDKYYNMDLSLSEIAQEDKITRQAVRDNIKKAEEKLEFFESKLKLYKNFKKEDNIVSKLERNIINLTAKITTLSIDKYEKEKLDNTLKEIIKNVDLKELSECLALPSQAIMDNIFYYGEAIILGNLPLEDHEYDMLISVSESISYIDKDIAYLQYGLIYKEIPLSDYLKLIKELKVDAQTFRREGIGFVIDTDNLKECIKVKSNSPCWEKHNKRKVLDLKNPAHIELKRKIFKAFGLDADKTYEENLKMLEVK